MQKATKEHVTVSAGLVFHLCTFVTDGAENRSVRTSYVRTKHKLNKGLRL